MKTQNAWIRLLVWIGLALTAGPVWAQSVQDSVVRHDSWWLPPPAAAESKPIDTMFTVIFVITTLTLVGVFAVLVVFLIKYRYREDRRSAFIHGHHQAEVIWTVTPAVVLLVMGILSIRTWGQLRMDRPGPEVETTDIEVLAQQFQWNFRYPGRDGKFGTRDDIGTFDMGDMERTPVINTFRVPVNKPVRIYLMSKDVLHSFFLPNVRMKLDAVPGLRGELWFTPTKVGRYDLACAELCGPQHYTMRGEMVVLPQEEYDAWMKERMEEVAYILGEDPQEAAAPADEPAEPAEPQEQAATPQEKEPAKPAVPDVSFEPVDGAEGTITGIVLFEGDPPRPRTFAVDADAHCKKAHPQGMVVQTVKVKDGKLAEVFVQIKSGLPTDKTWSPPSEPVVLNQEGCEYHPHVFGIMVGQPLKVVNSDSTNHNVHGFPKLNQQFNFSQAQKGMEKIIELTRAERFAIKCDVHNWMNAHAFVMEHPFFATTGEDGSFTISNVPPGTYEIEFWHETLGTKTLKNVTIEPGKGIKAQARFASRRR